MAKRIKGMIERTWSSISASYFSTLKDDVEKSLKQINRRSVTMQITTESPTYTEPTPTFNGQEDITVQIHMSARDDNLEEFVRLIEEECKRVIEERYPSTIQLLKPLDFDHKYLNNSSNYCTVLHTLAKSNCFRIMQYVFDCGHCFCSVHVTDKIGATPVSVFFDIFANFMISYFMQLLMVAWRL